MWLVVCEDSEVYIIVDVVFLEVCLQLRAGIASFDAVCLLLFVFAIANRWLATRMALKAFCLSLRLRFDGLLLGTLW